MKGRIIPRFHPSWHKPCFYKHILLQSALLPSALNPCTIRIFSKSSERNTPLSHHRYLDKKMAPRRGLEPPTYRLTAECSTIELSRNVITKTIIPSPKNNARLYFKNFYKSFSGVFPYILQNDSPSNLVLSPERKVVLQLKFFSYAQAKIKKA